MIGQTIATVLLPVFYRQLLSRSNHGCSRPDRTSEVVMKNTVLIKRKIADEIGRRLPFAKVDAIRGVCQCFENWIACNDAISGGGMGFNNDLWKQCSHWAVQSRDNHIVGKRVRQTSRRRVSLRLAISSVSEETRLSGFPPNSLRRSG